MRFGAARRHRPKRHCVNYRRPLVSARRRPARGRAGHQRPCGWRIKPPPVNDDARGGRKTQGRHRDPLEAYAPPSFRVRRPQPGLRGRQSRGPGQARRWLGAGQGDLHGGRRAGHELHSPIGASQAPGRQLPAAKMLVGSRRPCGLAQRQAVEANVASLPSAWHRHRHSSPTLIG